jgi:chemotaxis protein histidine kinase CheA
MFISSKRHEREKQELIGAGHRLIDHVLKQIPQCLFALDANDKVVPPISPQIAEMFRRRDFSDVSFQKLLQPVVSVKLLNLASAHLERLRAAPDNVELAASNPLEDVEVRLLQSNGSYLTAHYNFNFSPIAVPGEVGTWLVRVTDTTLQVQQSRELEDLRAQVQTQGEILRCVLKLGRTRFAASVQKIDAALTAINETLKKPAREQAAFRQKLEETLVEVDRIRREAATMRLSQLETAARLFEEALHALQGQTTLSGNDFLPLAVKLDALFSQFTLLRAATKAAPPAPPKAAASEAPAPSAEGAPRMTENGTEIIATPKFLEQVREAEDAAALRSAPAGSLENALSELTLHMAQEHGKTVKLVCTGLHEVPGAYQATVKNIAIQFIRNSIMHGIESPEERIVAKKPPHGVLALEFAPQKDGSYELRFEDDGRGLDPVRVRQIAVEKQLITSEAAERLRDRQAIKLIFKAGFTTLQPTPNAPNHGSGLSFVRRYVHDAGGKIALASLLGHETRYRVSLPPLAESVSQVA